MTAVCEEALMTLAGCSGRGRLRTSVGAVGPAVILVVHRARSPVVACCRPASVTVAETADRTVREVRPRRSRTVVCPPCAIGTTRRRRRLRPASQRDHDGVAGVRGVGGDRDREVRRMVHGRHRLGRLHRLGASGGTVSLVIVLLSVDRRRRSCCRGRLQRWPRRSQCRPAACSRQVDRHAHRSTPPRPGSGDRVPLAEPLRMTVIVSLGCELRGRPTVTGHRADVLDD